jgi:hypothetical protein
LEAHRILTELAVLNPGWRANSSFGLNNSCRFNGRPDLINDSNRTIFELKPNSELAIMKGRNQLNRYVSASALDRFRGIKRTQPYKIGNSSPTSQGFVGLESPRVGKYGTYTFSYYGGGIIVYEVSLHKPNITIPVQWVTRSVCDCFVEEDSFTGNPVFP